VCERTTNQARGDDGVYPINVKVYEHGIAANSDEWGGSLRIVSSTDLPVYSGFSLTIVDLEGRSLNARAVHLGHVNGAYSTADYFEESDLRYCVLATLYHLNRSFLQMLCTRDQSGGDSLSLIL